MAPHHEGGLRADVQRLPVEEANGGGAQGGGQGWREWGFVLDGFKFFHEVNFNQVFVLFL